MSTEDYPPLDPTVAQSLYEAYGTSARQNDFLDIERLENYYATFRNRFGPERLRALGGDDLLMTMHAHGSKDSLVYWLEFKNDDEFPSTRMGSIAGGTAHKFNLFKRKGTNQWVAGTPQRERPVSDAEAIHIAGQHRNELVAAATLVRKLSRRGRPTDYLHLQHALSRRCPTIYSKAWAHKYLSLLFPDRLDNYHSESWQNFHLLRSLLPRSQMNGLYANAHHFVHLAEYFRWPMPHLTHALNIRNGPPARYWRVNIAHCVADDFLRRGEVAIRWGNIGDLSMHLSEKSLRHKIARRLEEKYNFPSYSARTRAGEIFKFATAVNENDIVLVADERDVVYMGRVVGPYRFVRISSDETVHCRPVQWLSTQPFSLPHYNEGIHATVKELRRQENLLEVERRRLVSSDLYVYESDEDDEAAAVPTPPRKTRLDGIPGRLQALLQRKGQAILYGPPGTGKTYWAHHCARDLCALEAFGRLFDELSEADKQEVDGTQESPGLVRACTFHPGYGYEDFMEGYRPQNSPVNQVSFARRDGIFRQLCHDAVQASSRRFVLLVDEINRGDIPRIFGELLTLLEIDKRGCSGVRLHLSGEWFTVPPNVWIIGTMNTADRSIALLDVALRRRFGFIELMPDADVFGSARVGDSLLLGPWLRALNRRVRESIGRDARNLQIGHAYLLEQGVPVTALDKFSQVLSDDIVPLLEEYCYEDYTTLARILGPGLVDEANQCVRHELFAAGRGPELLEVLLAMDPEIATLTDADLSPQAPKVAPETEADDESPEL